VLLLFRLQQAFSEPRLMDDFPKAIISISEVETVMRSRKAGVDPTENHAKILSNNVGNHDVFLRRIYPSYRKKPLE
jgi:hypothetical protein